MLLKVHLWKPEPHICPADATAGALGNGRKRLLGTPKSTVPAPKGDFPVSVSPFPVGRPPAVTDCKKSVK